LKLGSFTLEILQQRLELILGTLFIPIFVITQAIIITFFSLVHNGTRPL